MVLDFIPIENYTFYYYQIILVVTLITFFHTQALPINHQQTLGFLKSIGTLTFIFVLGYIGLRPISSKFVDMVTYANQYERYRYGGDMEDAADVLFRYYSKFMATWATAEIYFFTCAAIYIFPLYSVSKKWFGPFWFYAFLALVGSFSFWSYGVNGIRNGMATSLFIYAISRDKLLPKIIFFYISIGFHKSMVLPLGGYILSSYFKNPKLFLAFWITCIPLSLAAGGVFEALFSTLGFDDRLSYLSEEAMEEGADKFSSSGFRWDFLIYSASPIFLGWYYIVKLNYKDKLYYGLYITYIFSNAFWILVIRAAFSNRFAYLSWFMMALVIMYPLLRHQILPDRKQHKFIGWTLLAYYGFTYFMFNVYYTT